MPEGHAAGKHQKESLGVRQDCQQIPRTVDHYTALIDLFESFKSFEGELVSL